jgi:hypothetical protein
VTAAKNAASGSKKQKSKPVKKAGDGKRRKLEGTAYDPVIYLPR